MILRDIKNNMHTCQICKRLIKDPEVAEIKFGLCSEEYRNSDEYEYFDEYNEVEVCTTCRNKIFSMIKEGKIK